MKVRHQKSHASAITRKGAANPTPYARTSLVRTSEPLSDSKVLLCFIHKNFVKNGAAGSRPHFTCDFFHIACCDKVSLV